MSADIDGPLEAEWMRGRTALVTGGGGREGDGPGTIGWAICRLFARHGAAVAVLDRDPAASGRTVAQIEGHGGTAIAINADVTSDADCARTVAEAAGALGSLDTLVNNVAAWSAGELFDFEPEAFDAMMGLNLKAAWSMTRHAAQKMQAGGGRASIVNISSVAAKRAGTMYGLGKAATEAMTEGAAFLLAERSIRINAVQLGPLWSGAVADNLPEEAREPRRRMVALQTEGTCWDAANAVLFLASDRARWISGQILAVDGGGLGRMPYPGVEREKAGAGSGPSS
jgi:NAD(P)-dependent dehydrogenase (short-subunit alcohol dehydrogenase family)